MGNKIADKIVFEDEYCRVWSLALKPGEATDWHTHDLSYVYVVTAASPARTLMERLRSLLPIMRARR